MNTRFWRWWFGVLAELVVTALAGSLLGPVIGHQWGYAWGYVSGLFGPVALAVMSLSLVLWARERWFRGDR